ncbi:MAG: ABC transporter permease [bacterium]
MIEPPRWRWLRALRMIDRKLARDAWRVKTQALAIALLIGCAVAMAVLSFAVLASLERTRDAYYDRYRFAHVWASLTRAPRSLEAALAAVPGVAVVESRVVADVTLAIDGLAEPAVGRLVSIPDRGEPRLDALHLREGRFPAPERVGEVLVSEAFAGARHLSPGDHVHAILNGRLQRLDIVGIALSPEYVYSLPAGGVFPDDERFGVMWMRRAGLEAAFDMKGAFDDVSLTLLPGASEAEVVDRVDRLLEPYGGLGAYGRRDQVSAFFVANEFRQLRTMGTVVPAIFLAVAAFLVSIVMSRLVDTEREEIATLKALGYSNRTLGWHYVKLVLIIVALGALIGVALGVRLGFGMTRLYVRYFHFPSLEFVVPPQVLVTSIAFAALACLGGALVAVRRAVELRPAEAMRPKSPPVFRPLLVDRLGLERVLAQSARMVLRHLEREPLRAGLTALGIAGAMGLLIAGQFSLDSFDFMADVQFRLEQREDAALTFREPRSAHALHAIERLPGVTNREPYRSVAVRLRAANRARLTAITGLAADASLHRVLDDRVRPVRLPPDGLVLSDKLARLLGVRRGESVRVEVLEGARPVREAVVADVSEQFVGTGAYMELGALHRLLREGESLSGAFLQVDPRESTRLFATLKQMPSVASVTLKQAALRSFRKTIEESMSVMISMNVMFAAIMVFGVVYNSARISLSERSRDLASLRVLGFTRAEISTILLGELGLVTVLALPLGCGIGWGLATILARMLDTDLYRIPFVIDRATYGLAAVVVIASAVASSLVVRRRLDHLDLVAVLKTRE